LASLFVGHAAQKSKLHNLQYDEGGNHMAEAEAEGQHIHVDNDNIDFVFVWKKKAIDIQW
jgi:hypothetical protein